MSPLRQSSKLLGSLDEEGRKELRQRRVDLFAQTEREEKRTDALARQRRQLHSLPAIVNVSNSFAFHV